MVNKICVLSTHINSVKIEVVYEVKGEIKKYFNPEEHSFWSEYSSPVDDVPVGIAVIPFVCNVLPLVWLTNTELELEELDIDFYNSIEKFKLGYVNMYSMLKFEGCVKVNKLTDNRYETSGKVASFFSGGVDAFATLIAHISERPILLTIWGADIRHEDIVGWKNVVGHVEKTVQTFDLQKVYVKTNFRYFINEKELNRLVQFSGDSWWHGFQHGIGLIGHAAPIAFSNKLFRVYIASTFTKSDHATCASDPTIDNYVSFCNCSTYHDQYEYSRQNKITHICRYVKDTHRQIELRVCWQSSGGKNCCHCEKCYRTIFGILAEGEDPLNYGFEYSAKELLGFGYQIRNKLLMIPLIRILWKDIQNRFIDNRENLPQFQELNWIYTYDFDKINSNFYKRILLLKRRIIKVLSLLKHKVLKH